MEKALIYGAGTYGEVYLSYLLESGVDVVGFIDDNKSMHGTQIGSVEVLGGRDILGAMFSLKRAECIYCFIGNNNIRVEILEIAKKIGFKTPNYIHPSAVISPNVKIGVGVYILLGSCIMPHTLIEDYVMISMGVNVAHHVKLCRGVFLSTRSSVGASITLNENVYVGMSATIVTGMHSVGANSLIGAGAIVLKDVEENVVMAGVPAKMLRRL